MDIVKKDTVIVISGKNKGKKGKVVAAMPKDGKLIVEGVNVATCHVKARKQTDVSGIVKRETPIRACKVQLYCATCKKGVRVGHVVKDGKKVRVCKSCGAIL
ncbi:MAG: 50S ribosomal protein L24 [Oscillospiraceae bacterium]|jgi:large subunit ribosomal protein L24|nr:50S ribosomal protein L24 [Oscillospiraceae bacterium]